MSEAFDKWFVSYRKAYGWHGPSASQAWNAAINAVVDALKSRERCFKSEFEKKAVLNDLARLKSE